MLQERTDLAMANLRELTATLQQAKSNSAQGAVDLSRLDAASEPSYPMKPKRYIYLALGLLIGALAGAVLTARAATTPDRRRARPPAPSRPTPTEGRHPRAPDERALALADGPRRAGAPAERPPLRLERAANGNRYP